MSNYIILRFGTRRVLLSSHGNQPATMAKPIDGDYVVFNFSPCEVLGSVAVEEGQPEPTPNDILAESRRFQLDCNQKIRNALTSADCVPANGPAS
jgi:hypothetical protein